MAKGLCNRCYYAKRFGRLTYPEQAAAFNRIEGGVGIISTKKGERFIVDLDGFEKCKGHIWSSAGNGYAKHTRLGYLHRFLCPQFDIVDHIDRDTYNNRRSNLREGRYINILNTDKRPTPRPIFQTKGGQWAARLKIHGERIWISQLPNRDAIVAKVARLLESAGRLEFYELAKDKTV